MKSIFALLLAALAVTTSATEVDNKNVRGLAVSLRQSYGLSPTTKWRETSMDSFTLTKETLVAKQMFQSMGTSMYS